MPIEPITQEQFKRCFTPLRGPKGSLWDRIQSQTLETRWYQYADKNRVGVVIYDGTDNDWSCVTLEDKGEGYATHEVRVSMPTERKAIETLMALFSCESAQTRDLMDRLNRQSMDRSGRSLTQVLWEVGNKG
jgi:hypothetical protein